MLRPTEKTPKAIYSTGGHCGYIPKSLLVTETKPCYTLPITHLAGSIEWQFNSKLLETCIETLRKSIPSHGFSQLLVRLESDEFPYRDRTSMPCPSLSYVNNAEWMHMT